MGIMQLAESFLFTVSSVLYYPVTIGLALLVLIILVLMGRACREYIDRKRNVRPALQSYRKSLAELLASRPGNHLELEMEKLLQNYETVMSRPVRTARFIVRAGPGIGLMGTLIPMGVALAALGEGSMELMAAQMVHAFNAVVVGLGASVIAFAIALLRDGWVRSDMNDMRYMTESALIEGAVPDEIESGEPSRESLGESRAAGDPA